MFGTGNLPFQLVVVICAAAIGGVRLQPSRAPGRVRGPHGERGGRGGGATTPREVPQVAPTVCCATTPLLREARLPEPARWSSPSATRCLIAASSNVFARGRHAIANWRA